jgi:uncharacterized repeat protein (TIGR04076 family)
MDCFLKKISKALNKVNDIKCTVESVKGTCCNGHKIGDEFIIKRLRTPGGMCVSAFHAIVPQFMGFVFDAKIPWEINNSLYVGCPDSNNCVTFKLEKIKKEI